MEEKKYIKISLSNLLLLLAILVIIIMAYYIYSEKNNYQKQTVDLDAKTSNIENTADNLNEEGNIKYLDMNTDLDNDSSSTNNTDNYSKKEAENNNTTVKSNDEDIVGKWNTNRAVNSEGQTENLADVFGTSYIQFGSYLELNEDGTFLDAIYPVTDGSNSVKGTYEIKKNYKKLGDLYIILNYEDGRTKILQKVYYEDNVESLSTEYTNDQEYQFDLKK